MPLKEQTNFALGWALLLSFSTLRFSAALYSLATGINTYLTIIFVLMAILPFIVLTKSSRKEAYFKIPKSYPKLLYSIFIGAFVAYLIFLLGNFIYGDTQLNWYRFIGETYPIDIKSINPDQKIIFFTIFLLIGLTFSPIGEEFFYRGITHHLLLDKYKEVTAACITSLAFGLVHLGHFGIFYQNGEWEYYMWPSVIWVGLMTVTGLIFYYCKSTSESIWGAVASHMGFNATMTWLIFYKIF